MQGQQDQMSEFDEKECYTKWRSFGKAERPRKFGSFYDTAKNNNPETFNEEPPKELEETLYEPSAEISNRWTPHVSRFSPPPPPRSSPAVFP